MERDDLEARGEKRGQNHGEILHAEAACKKGDGSLGSRLQPFKQLRHRRQLVFRRYDKIRHGETRRCLSLFDDGVVFQGLDPDDNAPRIP